MKLPQIPPRDPEAHKGMFGRILIIGGSCAMPGAAALAAWAALKAGAGLVKVAAPRSALASIAAHCPCYTLFPCEETAEGTLSPTAVPAILEEAKAADVLAIGPGVSTHPETVQAILKLVRNTTHPLVIDADGLNIVANDTHTLTQRKGFIALTPHPGEFASLSRQKTPGDAKGREAAAKALAEKLGCTVLLKGRGTVVTDGKEVYLNTTGNPGMATAGSGDVLTGVAAALLAVLPPGVEPLALSAYLHGLAGDLAAEAVGPVSVTALDILAHLPAAIRQFQQKGPV
ncbi:MAG: NAD(P)H-hydrate dehydratase [Planctomycetota bacterium]